MRHWTPRFFALAAALVPLWAVAEPDIEVRLRLMEDAKLALIESVTPLHVELKDRTFELEPGTYSFEPGQSQPEKRRYHLFAKSFPIGEEAAMRAYMEAWRAKGHTPETIELGLLHHLNSTGVLDNRIYWVSVAQTDTETQAEALKKKLDAEGESVWIQAETVRAGAGTVAVIGKNSDVIASFNVPFTVSTEGIVRVHGVDTGFWSEDRKAIADEGSLEIGIGPEGHLKVDKRIELERYLRGVLPAEMPNKWHAEALKAQAICARSDVLAHMGGRQTLLGYDFFVTEQSRAYVGADGREPETDAALKVTAGEILVKNGRIIPTVFSANCGGWTENNDTVWYGPPDDALRGIPDRPGTGAGGSPENIDAWLHNQQKAYCSRDKTYFRWRRFYTEPELRAIIQKVQTVGRIQEIETGDRGASGRLKWVRVTGDKGSVTIHKDLPIRQAFGGLPSSAFVVEYRVRSGRSEYVITGGGRGHGVGLCQHGAQGMAESGRNYRDIVTHYYAGAAVQRVR